MNYSRVNNFVLLSGRTVTPVSTMMKRHALFSKSTSNSSLLASKWIKILKDWACFSHCKKLCCKFVFFKHSFPDFSDYSNYFIYVLDVINDGTMATNRKTGSDEKCSGWIRTHTREILDL